MNSEKRQVTLYRPMSGIRSFGVDNGWLRAFDFSANFSMIHSFVLYCYLADLGLFNESHDDGWIFLTSYDLIKVYFYQWFCCCDMLIFFNEDLEWLAF